MMAIKGRCSRQRHRVPTDKAQLQLISHGASWICGAQTAMGGNIAQLLSRFSVEILLEPYEHLPDLLRVTEVGDRVSDGAVPEAKQR